MVNGYQRPVWLEGYSIFERRWAKLKLEIGRAARHYLNKNTFTSYPNHKMKSCKPGSFKNINSEGLL